MNGQLTEALKDMEYYIYHKSNIVDPDIVRSFNHLKELLDEFVYLYKNDVEYALDRNFVLEGDKDSIYLKAKTSLIIENTSLVVNDNSTKRHFKIIKKELVENVINRMDGKPASVEDWIYNERSTYKLCLKRKK